MMPHDLLLRYPLFCPTLQETRIKQGFWLCHYWDSERVPMGEGTNKVSLHKQSLEVLLRLQQTHRTQPLCV